MQGMGPSGEFHHQAGQPEMGLLDSPPAETCGAQLWRPGLSLGKGDKSASLKETPVAAADAVGWSSSHCATMGAGQLRIVLPVSTAVSRRSNQIPITFFSRVCSSAVSLFPPPLITWLKGTSVSTSQSLLSGRLTGSGKPPPSSTRELLKPIASLLVYLLLKKALAHPDSRLRRCSKSTLSCRYQSSRK